MIESEQVIVRDFINYCKIHFNIEFDVESNIYKKVKNSFERISNDSLPILRLKKKIAAKKQDYEDISAPYVRGESYGGYGGGAPIESYKVSYDENIHILRTELQQEISDLAVEKRILEKQLQDEHAVFNNTLMLLNNQIARQVLYMAYLEKQRYAEIALTLDYSYNTITQYVSNSIRDIAKKIKLFLQI